MLSLSVTAQDPQIVSIILQKSFLATFWKNTPKTLSILNYPLFSFMLL